MRRPPCSPWEPRFCPMGTAFWSALLEADPYSPSLSRAWDLPTMPGPSPPAWLTVLWPRRQWRTVRALLISGGLAPRDPRGGPCFTCRSSAKCPSPLPATCPPLPPRRTTVPLGAPPRPASAATPGCSPLLCAPRATRVVCGCRWLIVMALLFCVSAVAL